MSQIIPWVRSYRDSLHHPKILSLSDRLFRVWQSCLWIANDTGRLPKLSYTACHLRVCEAEAKDLISSLVEHDLIHFVCIAGDAHYVMHDWREYQPQTRDSRRPPAAEWKEIRERIFARDDYTCQYCDERGGKLQCDHIVPVARGGIHEDDNLITSCEACNMSKHAKVVSVEEWRSIRKGEAK